jgi:hypothetical protein
MKRRYFVVAVVIVAFLLVSKTFFYKQPFLTSFELQNPNGIRLEGLTENEAKPYLEFVKTFESLQRDHKAKEVLYMFTGPTTDKEKDILAWLDGSFAKLNKPMLYSDNQVNYKLNWYEINSIKKEKDQGTTVGITESRSIYNPAGDPKIKKDVYNTAQSNFIVKFNNRMQIQTYHYRESTSRQKYDGFYLYNPY